MAHIKCRYTEYRCGVKEQNPICKNIENENCDDYRDGIGEENGRYIIYCFCRNSIPGIAEFEADYKGYTFDKWSGLWIDNHGYDIDIDIDAIKYLEIDGRVIINKDEDKE